MPAKSKSQQRLMGMVHAYKKGELNLSDVPASLQKKVKEIASGMKDKSAKDFAKTKHKGLPEKVKESKNTKLCPKCEGSGYVGRWTKCPKCGGKEVRKLKENTLPTFKEFLIEITQKERQMLTPHPAVQKLYRDLKKKHGMVKRDTFMNAAIDRFNLSVPGLKKFASHPAIRALPFDDVAQADKPHVAPRDPWAHVTQKFAKREDRAKKAGLKGW